VKQSPLQAVKKEAELLQAESDCLPIWLLSFVSLLSAEIGY
jgi:hypothetical protein